jgi:hypothetical protein
MRHGTKPSQEQCKTRQDPKITKSEKTVTTQKEVNQYNQSHPSTPREHDKTRTSERSRDKTFNKQSQNKISHDKTRHTTSQLNFFVSGVAGRAKTEIKGRDEKTHTKTWTQKKLQRQALMEKEAPKTSQTKHKTTRQDKTRQDKTRQHKTKQHKTTQDNTRHKHHNKTQVQDKKKTRQPQNNHKTTTRQQANNQQQDNSKAFSKTKAFTGDDVVFRIWVRV